jgi:hypothetical protein
MAQPNKTSAATGEWECMECGYLEEGSETARPLKCPECNAGPEAFEFFSYDDEEWESEVEDEDLDEDDFEEDLDEDVEDLDDEDEGFDDFEDEDLDEFDDER